MLEPLALAIDWQTMSLSPNIKDFNLKKHHCCGLYYKHVMIVNDDSSILSKWSFKLIDDPRVVIYDHYKFIIQATARES
jgi:hypothetical protein